MKKFVMVMTIIMGGILMTEAKPTNPANNNAEMLAISLIAKFETFSPVPYLCPGKKWTIGYGCTDPEVIKKGTITKKEAERLLGIRVRKDLAWVKQTFPGLNAKQQAAITSLAFNVGRDGVMYKIKNGKKVHTNAYTALIAKDFERAAREIADFNKSNGVVLNGLIRRREAEIAWLI